MDRRTLPRLKSPGRRVDDLVGRCAAAIDRASALRLDPAGTSIRALSIALRRAEDRTGRIVRLVLGTLEGVTK